MKRAARYIASLSAVVAVSAALMWLPGPKAIAATTAYATAVLNDGPAGYWALGGTSGTSPNLATGTGALPALQYHGTVAVGPFPAVDLTNPSSTYSGTSSYSSAQRPSAIATTFTMTGWVNISGWPTNAGADPKPFSAFMYYGGTGIGVRSTGHLAVIHDTVSWTQLTTIALSLHTWYFVSLVQYSSNMAVTINGAQYVFKSATPKAFSSIEVAAGNNQGTGARYLEGSVSQVAFFNKALTATQTSALYQDGETVGSGAPAGSTVAYKNTANTQGAVAFWPVNGASGTQANEATNAGSATYPALGYAGAVTTGERPAAGIATVSSSFSGTASYAAAAAGSTLSGSFTLSGWVNITTYPTVNTGGDPVPFASFFYRGKTGIGVRQTGHLTIIADTVAWYQTTVKLLPHTWYMVALSYQASGSQYAAFINGTALPLISGTAAKAGRTLQVASGSPVAATSGRYLHGSVAQVAYFPTALASANSATLYVTGVTPSSTSGATNSSTSGTSVRATANISPGSLDFVSAPASLAWSWTENGHAAVHLPMTGTTEALQVADARGSGAGWAVELTSTTFQTTANHVLPTTAASVQTAPAAYVCTSTDFGGCTVGANSAAYPYAVPAAASAPTATILASANTTTGMGDQTISVPFDLTIPASAYAGTYHSTWTFSLVSGP